MTDRTPLAEQLHTVERLLVRAKAEKDWPTIAPLKATADLIRWTMANAETLKAAAIGQRDFRPSEALRSAMRRTLSTQSSIMDTRSPPRN